MLRYLQTFSKLRLNIQIPKYLKDFHCQHHSHLIQLHQLQWFTVHPSPPAVNVKLDKIGKLTGQENYGVVKA
jgi:hypothetical protein